MVLLAIETATEMGSFAVVRDGVLVGEVSARVAARHGETVIGRVEDLLRMCGVAVEDVAVVACGIGPGSFTGLRIGLSTAKGIALGRGVPVIGVPTLDVLLAQKGRGAVLAAIDAHKGEVFASLAIDGEVVLPAFSAISGVVAERVRAVVGGSITVIGNAVRTHAGLIAQLGDAVGAPSWMEAPRAAVLGALAWRRHVRAEYDDLAGLAPIYGRGADAKPLMP